VTQRAGRDLAWSLYHHHATANEQWHRTLHGTPGLVGPPVERPPASIRHCTLARAIPGVHVRPQGGVLCRSTPSAGAHR
jgi:hypothetical protein